MLYRYVVYSSSTKNSWLRVRSSCSSGVLPFSSCSIGAHGRTLTVPFPSGPGTEQPAFQPSRYAPCESNRSLGQSSSSRPPGSGLRPLRPMCAAPVVINRLGPSPGSQLKNDIHDSFSQSRTNVTTGLAGLSRYYYHPRTSQLSLT
jgi:hypothetical protein